MYYNITSGEIKIKDLHSRLEDYSKKQNSDDIKLFNVYKLFDENDYIWLRTDKKTDIIRNFHCPLKTNEYKYIIIFLQINPFLEIKTDQNELIGIELA
ncbi:MAG: hypothetical protein RBT49_01135 [Bacteroidales bacterium]|jgi:hypothetical protein|nr:hypothetical protein [Bacteroidales bacterium]